VNIPSLDELRAPFEGLKTGELRKAAEEAGMPFTTFWKVVKGKVADPRIETVRALAAYVQRRRAAAKRAAKKELVGA
jgi:predicted transcriptional regulator